MSERGFRPLFLPLYGEKDGAKSTRFGSTVPKLYATARGARESLKLFKSPGEVRLVEIDALPVIAPMPEELADAYLRAEKNCQLWGAKLKQIEHQMANTIGGEIERPPLLTPSPLLEAALRYARSKCECPRAANGTIPNGHRAECKRKAAADAVSRECEAAAQLADAGVPL